MTHVAVTPVGAADLLQYVELTAVRTYALSGRREEGATASADVAPEVAVRLGDFDLEIRMRMIIRTAQAEFETEMAVVYQLARPVNMWSATLSEFVARVGVMALYPFVREAIFATASRMGIDQPVLGLVRQGQLTIGDVGGPELAPSRVPASVTELAREFSTPPSEVRAALESLGIEPPPGRARLTPDQTAAARHAWLTAAPEFAG